MRSYDLIGICKCIGFRFEKIFVSAEIGERSAFGMKQMSLIEPILDFNHRQRRHNNIKRSAAEGAALPKERKKVLLDYEVQIVVGQLFGVASC